MYLQLATAEQLTAIFGVLGQVHISDAAEEDLKAKEDIKVNGSLEPGNAVWLFWCHCLCVVYHSLMLISGLS